MPDEKPDLKKFVDDAKAAVEAGNAALTLEKLNELADAIDGKPAADTTSGATGSTGATGGTASSSGTTSSSSQRK